MKYNVQDINELILIQEISFKSLKIFQFPNTLLSYRIE